MREEGTDYMLVYWRKTAEVMSIELIFLIKRKVKVLSKL